VWRTYKATRSKTSRKKKAKGKPKLKKGKKPKKRLSQDLVWSVVGTRWGTINTIKAKLPGFKKPQIQRHLNKLKKEGKILSHSIGKVTKWKLNLSEKIPPKKTPEGEGKKKIPTREKTGALRKKKSEAVKKSPGSLMNFVAKGKSKQSSKRSKVSKKRDQKSR
jgi:hypothetical protein